MPIKHTPGVIHGNTVNSWHKQAFYTLSIAISYNQTLLLLNKALPFLTAVEATLLSHSATDASQKLFICVFLLKYCTAVIKITCVKQIYVLIFFHVFLNILAGLLKYTTFFHIPCLAFSAYRLYASWDPFDHICYLRALLSNACFPYFDLTVVKIAFFSRKGCVDHLRESAAGSHHMQIATGPLGWSGASGEEN